MSGTTPTFAWVYVNNNEQIKKIMEDAMRTVSQGNILSNDGCPVNDLPLTYRVKLIEVEEGWQKIVKNLIANSQNPNQALISEKVFWHWFSLIESGKYY